MTTNLDPYCVRQTLPCIQRNRCIRYLHVMRPALNKIPSSVLISFETCAMLLQQDNFSSTTSQKLSCKRFTSMVSRRLSVGSIQHGVSFHQTSLFHWPSKLV